MPKKVREVPEAMRDMGARIVQARNELGLNQAELAGRAGVDATVLNRLETRKQHDVAASFVVRVAAALRRSTDSLLTDRPNAAPVTILAEPGVPHNLVEATAREIAARVVPLLPEQGRSERPSPSRKARGPKRNARKA